MRNGHVAQTAVHQLYGIPVEGQMTLFLNFKFQVLNQRQTLLESDGGKNEWTLEDSGQRRTSHQPVGPD